MDNPEAYLHAMVMMEAAHQVIHERENDVEDTLFVALTEREVLLVGLGLACLFFDYPCLGEDSRDLQRRLVELAQTQKPEWVVKGEDVQD